MIGPPRKTKCQLFREPILVNCKAYDAKKHQINRSGNGTGALEELRQAAGVRLCAAFFVAFVVAFCE